MRTIAATNRDLAEAVAKGEFRQDLFYRLNVFPIEIPPLRERGEDGLLLAELFTESAADRFGMPRKPLDREHARRPLSYRWPGNVRELQNIVEHAVITSWGDRLCSKVPLDRSGATRETPVKDAAATIMTAAELRDLQRENMIRALEACGGRIAGDKGAARLLGMKASTLRSQMKALGIPERID